VDVASGAKHVIETTEPDVVCPTVTADDPKTLVDELVRQTRQTASLRRLLTGDCSQEVFQRHHSFALCGDLGVTNLIRTKECTDNFVSDVRPQLLKQPTCLGGLLLGRQPQPEPELSGV